MSYTSLMYHIVFATKDRRPLLSGDIGARLGDYVGGILRNVDGVLLAFGGAEDHVHVAALLSPKQSVSDVARTVKANSSKWVHQAFLAKRDFAWQDGYAAFTIARSGLPRVVRYIERQAEHHRQLTFDDELRALLQKHGVEYDDRYLS